MSVDYYPYVDVAELYSTLDAGWNVSVIAKPKSVNAMPGTPKFDVVLLFIRILNPDQAPASTGVGVLRETVTPFYFNILGASQTDAEKTLYEVERIVNQTTKSSAPMRAWWEITGWVPHFKTNYFEFEVYGREVLLR